MQFIDDPDVDLGIRKVRMLPSSSKHCPQISSCNALQDVLFCHGGVCN